MAPRRRHTGVGIVLTAIILLASACGRATALDTSALDDDAITVGSFNFPESILLGEIYAQALEGAGYRVERLFDLGSRELVVPALQRGLVEVLPEYGGSALAFMGGAPTADPDATHLRLLPAAAERGITALDPAPAMDQNGFAMTRERASELGVQTLSDLAPIAHELTFAGPPECRDRPLCLQGLRDTYGVRFGTVLSLDTGGPLTAAALRGGQADVGLLFTSDPTFRSDDFMLLRDDRGLEPADAVTPLVREETLQRFGDGVGQALDAVSARLTTDDLREMNLQVAQGSPPSRVAREWLARAAALG